MLCSIVYVFYVFYMKLVSISDNSLCCVYHDWHLTLILPLSLPTFSLLFNGTSFSVCDFCACSSLFSSFLPLLHFSLALCALSWFIFAISSANRTVQLHFKWEIRITRLCQVVFAAEHTRFSVWHFSIRNCDCWLFSVYFMHICCCCCFVLLFSSLFAQYPT